MTYLIGSLLAGLLPKCILKFVMSFDIAMAATALTKEGESSGKMPLRRMQVYIVGEPGAGKTNLCKKLMGRKVVPEEQPSVGYPTWTCTMWNKKDSWTCWLPGEKSCESYFYDVLNRYIFKQTLANDGYKVFPGKYSAKDYICLLFASLPVLSVIAGIYVFEHNEIEICTQSNSSHKELEPGEKDIIIIGGALSFCLSVLLVLLFRLWGCLVGILCPLWILEMYGTCGTILVVLYDHHTVTLGVTPCVCFITIAFSMSVFVGIGSRTTYYAICGFTIAPLLVIVANVGDLCKYINSSSEKYFKIQNWRLIHSVIAQVSFGALISLLACIQLQRKDVKWAWGISVIVVQACYLSGRPIFAVYRNVTFWCFSRCYGRSCCHPRSKITKNIKQIAPTCIFNGYTWANFIRFVYAWSYNRIWGVFYNS